MATETESLSTRIEIRGLVKRYHHQPVLNQITLTLNNGEFCILVGDNGAGKTTLLRILAGLVQPTQGEIAVGGSSLAVNPNLRRIIGYVGHQPMLYQDLTAQENLRHYARLYQIQDTESAVTHSMAGLGLTLQQDQPVRTFSRGMQQRLSLARALLHNPSILLFDEPYTGLDQDAAIFLDHTLRGLHTPGRTILLAAHRPQRLLTMASHIAWLRNGCISQHILVKTLHEAPQLSRYLQEEA